MNRCLKCEKETANSKFCSRSCSASFNNRGVKRGNPSDALKKHFKENGVSDEKRRKLSKAAKGHNRNPVVHTVMTKEQIKRKKAQNKAKVYAYRARRYNAIMPDSDMKRIAEIYENCPDGYHVDHKVALADGGKHHQDNLQYLPADENCRKGAGRNYDASKAIEV